MFIPGWMFWILFWVVIIVVACRVGRSNTVGYFIRGCG